MLLAPCKRSMTFEGRSPEMYPVSELFRRSDRGVHLLADFDQRLRAFKSRHAVMEATLYSSVTGPFNERTVADISFLPARGFGC
jgi:hypothetical protein